MGINARHVLPADVTLVPVRELDDSVREKLHTSDDDFALWRPMARTSTKIVDGNAARMLQLFRKPRRIVDVIVEFSRKEQLDRETTLREAFPLLSNLIDAGILVEEGSDGERPIAPVYDVGARVGRWEVVACIQLLNDVELHQVRDDTGRTGALKASRSDAAGTRGQLEREAKVLSKLAGSGAPRLLDVGEYESRPFLVMEWRTGVDASTAAKELWALRAAAPRRCLELCCAVADAYAALHASGVLHGDVHERNILVDAFGNVCILDFGLARTIDDAGQPPPRGGIGTYFEPEYAQARYEGHRVPPVTESGEQYSIAALLYYLYAGAHYIEFALETRDALRQTASAVPLSFAERSVRPFPALERVLATAMSKHPAQRYATTAEFAQRLRDVLTSMDVVASDGASFGGSAERRAVIDAALNALAPQAALFEHGALDAPTCSVNFGAAGIACALYRMALARDDAVLLSQADAWCNRAKAWLTSDSAFDAPALDITREGIGSISLYHSVTGVYVIAALIANAMGDYASLQYNLDAFVSAAAQPCDNPDLTLGRSGTLLSCALLLEAIPRTPLVKTAAVRRLGATTYRGIWAQIMTHPDVREPAPFLNLGIAHGWAGVLYASLRWAGVSRRRPPLRVRDRLDQLARCAEPFGRGLRWSWREPRAVVSSRGYMSGWCNGSAGFVYLWLLAHDMLGGTAYERLATGAAWSAWDGADENSPDLCCGVGGRAYALLAMHRHTGDEIWLQRASMLGETAAALSAGVGPRELTSLYKGPLGSALLAVELERPERARMPLFEREGWPAP